MLYLILSIYLVVYLEACKENWILNQIIVILFYLAGLHLTSLKIILYKNWCKNNVSKFQAKKLSGNGDLNYELGNNYSLGEELCLGALTFFYPFVNHQNVSIALEKY